MDTPAWPIEHEDRWLLNYRGLLITKISIDYRLTLLLGADVEVVVECPARISHGPLSNPKNPSTAVVPERQDVAAALSLFGAKVLSAVAFKSGGLRMVFDTGLHLNCPADPSCEAWQATGPGQWKIVSRPGGDLSVWRGEHHPSSDQAAQHTERLTTTTQARPNLTEK
ncbi:DUF6188 family protein [Actinocorallia sp. A-T 12471]|uniref:DUF6188 family protein n=1 Tax=Actinocorallia sp. A-T 12471 TaxID=3089813 RepID=UPI0029D2A802|nr:DUF6188 family protein [Actinocorallia sp. A-T 12471]MDX6742929.1 DUF6188 family protein [Actinocorallia sp. A-T 12471]